MPKIATSAHASEQITLSTHSQHTSPHTYTDSDASLEYEPPYRELNTEQVCLCLWRYNVGVQLVAIAEVVPALRCPV